MVAVSGRGKVSCSPSHPGIFAQAGTVHQSESTSSSPHITCRTIVRTSTLYCQTLPAYSTARSTLSSPFFLAPKLLKPTHIPALSKSLPVIQRYRLCCRLLFGPEVRVRTCVTSSELRPPRRALLKFLEERTQSKWLMPAIVRFRKHFYYTPFINFVRSLKWR